MGIGKSFGLIIFEFGSTLEVTLFIQHNLGENRQDGDFSSYQAMDGLLTATRKYFVTKMYEY